MTTLRALECLIAVLDHGSMTKAAAQLSLSQPALSHQLAGLEREIGGPVLERLPRGVRATTVGRAIERDARTAVQASLRVVSAGRAVASGRTGHLRVACAESLTVPILAPVLRAWHRRHPEIEVVLQELSSAQALAALVAAGEAEVAVGPDPGPWNGRTVVIGREQLIIALPTDHPLSRSPGPLTLAALAEHPLIHYHPDNGLAGWLDTTAAQHGVSLTVAMRARQAVTAAQLAAAGLGAALVPMTAVTASFPGTLRSLDPVLSRDIVTMSIGTADPIVGRLEALLRRRGIPVPAAISAQLSTAGQ